jgi:hypothetical protein
MQVYEKIKDKGEFFAKAAAMATYVGASKGIAAMEKADTRHWTTLPQAFRMSEMNLAPGTYQVGILTATKEGAEKVQKILGNIKVAQSGKGIHTFKLITP